MGSSESKSRTTSGSSNSIMEPCKYDGKVLCEMTCAICFNKYEDQVCIPMSLKCGHTYCKSCIDKLFSTTPECPLCRNPITQNCPVKNYALLDLISGLKTEESISENYTAQLETLKEELNSGINGLYMKSEILTKTLEKVDNLLKEQSEDPMTLNAESTKATIAGIKSTLNLQGSQMVPKVIASPLPDPTNYLHKIYGIVESGTKMLCVHQPSYNSGLTYGNISVWSNTLFFHSLTLKSSSDCEEFLSFDDLKKVIPTMKIKTFLKVKTITGANQIILMKPVESPLLPQFIRLCTGETGSCYKGVTFEKGEDRDAYCKSVMKLVSYQNENGLGRGNIDYAFEMTEEVYFKNSETVVVGSLDGGFQMFHSDYKANYKNVVGVIESPLNIKDLLSYDTHNNVKIIESGIAFQL